MSDVPLSLAHLSELDVPPLELVELAARAGFASIGLRTAPASPGGVVYPLTTEAEQAEMRRRLAANGVKVLEVEMVPLSGATRVADYRPMLETGAAIGASRLTVGGDSTDFAAVADRLAEMAELALRLRDRGRSRIHAVPAGASRSRDAVDVVTRADHPNAHILIDALHVFRSGTSPQEFSRRRSRSCSARSSCAMRPRRRRRPTSWSSRRARAGCCRAQADSRCRR